MTVQKAKDVLDDTCEITLEFSTMSDSDKLNLIDEIINGGSHEISVLIEVTIEAYTDANCQHCDHEVDIDVDLSIEKLEGEEN